MKNVLFILRTFLLIMRISARILFSSRIENLPTLKDQVSLMVVTYINIDETSFWNKQKNFWNIKYFLKSEKRHGTGRCIKNVGIYYKSYIK